MCVVWENYNRRTEMSLFMFVKIFCSPEISIHHPTMLLNKVSYFGHVNVVWDNYNTRILRLRDKWLQNTSFCGTNLLIAAGFSTVSLPLIIHCSYIIRFKVSINGLELKQSAITYSNENQAEIILLDCNKSRLLCSCQ